MGYSRPREKAEAERIVHSEAEVEPWLQVPEVQALDVGVLVCALEGLSPKVVEAEDHPVLLPTYARHT